MSTMQVFLSTLAIVTVNIPLFSLSLFWKAEELLLFKANKTGGKIYHSSCPVMRKLENANFFYENVFFFMP